jgi:hypothetical protein
MVFSLLGVAAALVAISPSDAEAQTAGMERPQARRQKRVEAVTNGAAASPHKTRALERVRRQQHQASLLQK